MSKGAQDDLLGRRADSFELFRPLPPAAPRCPGRRTYQTWIYSWPLAKSLGHSECCVPGQSAIQSAKISATTRPHSGACLAEILTRSRKSRAPVSSRKSLLLIGYTHLYSFPTMAYSRKMYFQSLAEIFIGEVRYYMTVTLTVLTFGSKALSKLLFSFAVLTLLIAMYQWSYT